MLVVVFVVADDHAQCVRQRRLRRRAQATFGEASAEYQQCQRNASSGGFRTGGGSFGGYSSGSGGHK
jgi:uncharacterized membrane protein YgcG